MSTHATSTSMKAAAISEFCECLVCLVSKRAADSFIARMRTIEVATASYIFGSLYTAYSQYFCLLAATFIGLQNSCDVSAGSECYIPRNTTAVS